jgi:hypothetical protein
MTPLSFTALTVTNLNNGTTTKAVTIQEDDDPVLPRLMDLVGGAKYDARGNQESLRQPIRRRVPYVATFSTPALLAAHVNTLRRTDKGKKGTLTFDGGDGEQYASTGILEGVEVQYLFDTPKQKVALITLVVQEATPLTEVV